MRRALELAARGWGRVSPNPLVGCVLVRDGRAVGEGWHEGPGTEHAEAMALRVAGDRAAGATAFVTLEPCDHRGRTPPCARALIDAGVEGVIAATGDPNPIVDGSGFRALRDAGLTVEVGLLGTEAIRQNVAFSTHVRTGRPFVVLKMASSLDGKAAARDGSSKWITGEEARADVQRLRAWSDAVIVGSGTALADDPRLTVRDPAFADRVRRRARNSGLGDRVRFPGPRSGPELDGAYAAADLLVLASHAETYGMVVTEALARGLPVLATDVGGVTEALPGLLVPPGDPAALGAALRAWLEDAELRDRLRRAARERRATLRPWAATSSDVAGVLGGVAAGADGVVAGAAR